MPVPKWGVPCAPEQVTPPGAAPRVLLRSRLGAPSVGGVGGAPAVGCLEVLGVMPPPQPKCWVLRRQTERLLSPSTPLHPTAPCCTPPPQPGEVARGWGGPAQGARCWAVTPRGAAVQGVLNPPPMPRTAPGSAGGPRPGGQPRGPSPPQGTLLRATSSTRARGAPSARPPQGGWGGRQALISAGVN